MSSKVEDLFANRFENLADVSTSGDYTDLSNKPYLGSACGYEVEYFATSAQGTKADTAVQPETLAVVATSGAYADLTGNPSLGTASSQDISDFATAAQGAKADTAIQASDLALVATSGIYNDLSGKPTLGTVASHAATDFATAAQGATADTAVQPGSLANISFTGAYSDLSGTPSLGTASSHSTSDFATAAQGSTADSAVQSVNGHTGTSVSVTKSDIGLANVDNTSDANKPISTATQTALNLKANSSSLALVATSGIYNDLTGKPTLGTASAQNISFFATAAQGSTADTAVQSVNGHTGTSVSVTRTDLSLDNVTNDSQLKRAAGDFVSFTSKGIPVNADILLIEDSASSNAKKKITLDTLPYPVTSVASRTGAIVLTSSDVGLGNVTNDSQLKRAANDFASFTNKATPVVGDILLLEDSAASGVKKYSTITNLSTQAFWNANKLQGFAIHTASPADQQVLMWINANTRWEPTSLGLWTTWVPVITPTSGTFTSVVITYARFMQIGKTIWFALSVTGTTASGVSSITFSLPSTPVSSRTYGFGGQLRDGGFYSVAGTIDSVAGGTVKRGTNNPITNGTLRGFDVEGFYEIP